MTRKTGQRLSDLERQQRLNLARQCAHEGVTGSEFARRCGLTKAGAHLWLTRNCHFDILDQLNAAKRASSMPDEQADKRARLLAECALGLRTLRSVARIEGVSDAAISLWKKANWIAVEDALFDERLAK
jgi:transposase-like protein